ncbi:DUF3006 domain-containing protein [Alkalithermobacter thermoalcaliphilus]
MKGIIDRFEGELAVIELENKTFMNIHKKLLPNDCKEGDVVVLSRDGTIEIDYNAYKKLREEIDNLMDELFE